MANSDRFTFICGSDDFLVQRQGARVWEGFCAEVGDPYSCEVVDGAAATVAEVAQAVSRFAGAVRTLSMFGARKAVWLRHISFLADTVTGRAEGTLEQVEFLQEVLAGIDQDAVRVVLTASPVDRRRKVFKWLQEHGRFVLVGDAASADALAAVLEEEATAWQARFVPGAAQVLAGKVNGNTRLALEELRKLTTYLGKDGGVIDEALINALVPPLPEGDFFETVEAFFARDLNWTLEAIRRHFFAGNDARPMISSLQSRNRLLIQLHVLAGAGAIGPRPSQQQLQRAAERYGKEFAGAEGKSTCNVFSQNPWYLSRLTGALDKFSLRQLIDCQAAFLDAFTGILERPNDQEGVLRETAIRCIG